MANPTRIVPSDSELLDAMQKGDEEAAAELCMRHDTAILRVLIAFLTKHRCDRPREHSEAIKNGVWINILRSLGSLRDVHSFNAWRDEIARNEANRHLATDCIPGGKIFVALESQSSLPQGLITHNNKVIENATLVDEMLVYAENISPRLAQIIQLLHEEGLSWDEIAAKLGEKKETLRTVYNRGLIKLRKRFGDRGS